MFYSAMVYKTVVIFHWKSVCLLCAASARHSVGVQRINGFSDFNLFHELFLLLCLTIGNSIVLLCLVPLRYIEMFFNLSTLNNYFAFFILCVDGYSCSILCCRDALCLVGVCSLAFLLTCSTLIADGNLSHWRSNRIWVYERTWRQK